MIGVLGETKLDIQDAITFLKGLGANWYMIFVATPLVGSEMYNMYTELHDIDFTQCNYKKASMTTKEFTSDYIQEVAYLINLNLNFVNNSDYLVGNYETALRGFKNALVAKPDHAFAYYYASLCYKKLEQKDKYLIYYNKAKELFETPVWKGYKNALELKLK
jgi:tetratricopeptide (TPR) repeat protein